MTRGQATSRKTARNDRNGHNAARNVKKVQAGYAEESGAKQRRTPRILEHTNAFIDETNPFTNVEPGKYQTQQNRGPEKAPSLCLVAGFGGVNGAKHRQAAREKDERHEHDVQYARVKAERSWPVGARRTQVAISEKQRSERHRVGDNEQPHRQFSGRNAVRRSFH